MALAFTSIMAARLAWKLKMPFYVFSFINNNKVKREKRFLWGMCSTYK